MAAEPKSGFVPNVFTALFALSNRIAHLTALRPNDEFYLMGRIPRA